jgi:hypothetical protein
VWRGLPLALALLLSAAPSLAQTRDPEPLRLPAWAEPDPCTRSENKALCHRVKQLERAQLTLQRQLARARDEEDVSLAPPTVPDRQRLRLYGFFDTSFSNWWINEDLVFGEMLEDEAMFVLGNLNLYLDSNPVKDWRFLAEIMFRLDPQGQMDRPESKELGTSYSLRQFTTMDSSTLLNVYGYGAVGIERAWVEWGMVDWLKITVGLFLTPYGIWNIDHGSPTRILAAIPLMYLSWASFFPSSQLGLKIHGTTLARDLELGYAVTVSNGRNPFSDLKDSDWDKGVGLRLHASSLLKTLRWKLGFSLYSGDYSFKKKVLVLAPQMDMEEELEVLYRETALGVDLALDWGPFVLHWELMANWRNYADGRRGPADLWEFIPFDVVSLPSIRASSSGLGEAADKRSLGSYGILAYRLPLRRFNIRPFIHAFYVDFTDNSSTDDLLGLSAGINWRIRGKVVFKVEHLVYRFLNHRPAHYALAGMEVFQQTVLQTAVAF